MCTYCTYCGMLNSEENISKNRIDAIDASVSCNQFLITFLNKLLLTYVIDTVGFHRRLSHISLHGRVVVSISTNKTETHQVRITVGGDNISYEVPTATQCTILITTKILLNHVVSTIFHMFIVWTSTTSTTTPPW